MRSRTETELAWAAGLFEGEGHFAMRRRRPGYRTRLEMGLTSTDLDVIQRFAAIVDCGYVKPKRMRKTQPHWKPQYAWACGSHEALDLAESFRPLLSARRLARLDEILHAIAESQPKPRPCEQCGETFMPTRFARERFCSDKCRDRAKYLRRKAAA